MILPIFETNRLLLRPISLEDAPQIQAKFPHWEIVKFLNASDIPWPYPVDGAEYFIKNYAIPNNESGSILTWSIFLKSSPQTLIGGICLMQNADENRGFWVDIPQQGNGYISEACETITDFWFSELGHETLIVPKAINNKASRRISQKQEMRLIGTKTKQYVCGECQTEIWQIDKEEWIKRRNQSQVD